MTNGIHGNNKTGLITEANRGIGRALANQREVEQVRSLDVLVDNAGNVARRRHRKIR